LDTGKLLDFLKLRRIQTPYGEIPDKFARDMRPQEMHDFLRKRYGRRTVLKGAGIAAAAVAAGPIFWKQADVFAAGSSTTTTPQWIGYGSNPATSLWVSWTDGSAGASPSPVPTATSGQPNSAVLMYATSLTTLQANGGQVVPASLIGQVPIPSGQPSGNVDDTYYISVLLTGLTPGTKYYYQVSNNNGTTWNPSAYFTTAPSTVGNFTFCATGDEYEASSTASVVASILAYDPAFTIVAGDLSYASGGTATLGKTAGANDGNTAQQSYSPGEWDTYFSYMGESAQYIPWLVGVGNHEMEPLTVDGYAGILTRFPDLAQQANGGSNTTESGSTFTYTGSSFTWNGYTITNGTTYNSGSPVVRTYTYGNVAFIQLDGNDLSAEISENNGYTGGQQTNWLLAQLATYRAGLRSTSSLSTSTTACTAPTGRTARTAASATSGSPSLTTGTLTWWSTGTCTLTSGPNPSSTTRRSSRWRAVGATPTSTPTRGPSLRRRGRSAPPPTSAPEAADRACTPPGWASLAGTTAPRETVR
jgi:hypothetical protein